MTVFDDARAAVAGGASPDSAAAGVVAAMTPDEQLWCLDGDAPTWEGLAFLGNKGYHRMPFVAGRIERLGFPGIAFSDGPRGVVIGNGTCFPVAMARGAAWDPDLEERVGDAIGRELRASGATLTGAVCVNLLRHPAWGRAQETYGEDPHHVGEMGAAFTRGLQHHVMACVKHFACNSMENARFSVDVTVDDVALHEVYLAQFRRIVDEGAASVMSAYNSVNGDWCGENRALLTDVLRDEWSFAGFVISDWIFGLRDASKSVRAGLDVEMPYRMIRAPRLSADLEAGDVTWDDVRAAAIRMVATVLRFDAVLSRPVAADVIGCTDHRALAREAAARSIVVLRNEGVLPLDNDRIRSMAVIGRLADTVNVGDAGSSDVWDVECRTVLDGLRENAGGDRVVYDDGEDVAAAAAVAGGADVAVVVVGNTYLDEGEYIGDTGPELAALFPAGDEPDVVERYQCEIAALPPLEVPNYVADRPSGPGFGSGGDRTSLRLAPRDVELVRAVAAANHRTVVALQGGSAILTSEWDGDVGALVHTWYGGWAAGSALADVLFGVINPSARLPFTIPADESHLPPFDRDATEAVYDRWHGWWHLERSGRRAAYPFGFGLSYTTFTIERADVSCDGDTIAVTGLLTNTGDRDGADVVQVYAELPEADTPRRLVGFARVEVAAGQRAPFTIRVPVDRLARRDAARRAWTAGTGRHRLSVGRHVEDPDAQVVVIDV